MNPNQGPEQQLLAEGLDGLPDELNEALVA